MSPVFGTPKKGLLGLRRGSSRFTISTRDSVLIETSLGTPTPISGRDAMVSDALMSSTRRTSRSRYRFGFFGKRPTRNLQPATTDEILDSLVRQAELIEEGGKERTLELQTLLEVDSDEQPGHPSGLESVRTFQHLKTRHFGKSVFEIMLIGGLAIVWIYFSLS